jgi:hypothetical protein
MKPFKGKNVIAPDKGWFICEYSYVKPNHRKNNKKFYVRKFNRELRQFFRKMLRGCKDVAED